MSHHFLKTWPKFYRAVFVGIKRFEIRKNDRNFKKGDTIFLFYFDPEKEKVIAAKGLPAWGPEGPALMGEIIYLTEFAQDGYVVFGLGKMTSVNIPHPGAAPFAFDDVHIPARYKA